MKTHTKDYYKILGVSEKAEETAIKKAYRKLAMEYHPDHNRDDPQSEEKFKEITEAYGVLMDPLKRKEYDRYRTGFFSGSQGDRSDFRYSQQEIFENMFRQGFGRDMFNDLNTQFQGKGFRYGSNFFGAIFFSGAVGKLTNLMGMVPGPIGKIGKVLRLLQMVGGSLYAAKKAKEASGIPEGEKDSSPSITNTIKGFFGKANSLDLNFNISIKHGEALSGTKKKVSYKVSQENEKLLVTIPPGIKSGGKLRLKEKGKKKNGQRGDLVITIQVEPV